MAIVEKFGAQNQYDFAARRASDMRTDKQLSHMYDFDEEYAQVMRDWSSKAEDQLNRSDRLPD